jgi:hypothetical protein
VEVKHGIAVVLYDMADILGHTLVRMHVEQNAARIAHKPHDQFVITNAPIMPASGSVQTQPNACASSRPMIASTETAASAMT